MRNTETPNAYAAGRRSVAVSTGLLRLLSTGQLTREHAVAIGVHEVGHHTTGSARYGLLAQWWSWPWQATYRGIMRLGGGLPLADAAVVLLPVLFGIAIVQNAAQDAPAGQKVPVPVGVLAVGIFVYPVVDAALARAGEYGRGSVRGPCRRR